MQARLLAALKELPFIVILRGVPPGDAEEIADHLVKAGIRCIEVPFTSPDAAHCIRLLSRKREILVGGGTVLNRKDATACLDAGGTYALAPNVSAEVIRHARTIGLPFVPGFHTATEAFAALDAGAQILKFFPAGEVGSGYLKSLMPLLPPTPIIATGSVTPSLVKEYLQAGALAVALGGAVYQPGDTAAVVVKKLSSFLKAVA